MKTTLFLSSIFFLLGLKVSNLVDLRGKAQNVDKIIINKIIGSKPVKALPILQDEEQDEKTKENKIKEEPVQQKNDTGELPEK